MKTSIRIDLMYLRKHISRLSLYFWKPKKSEKIVFKKFLSYFMPFSLYIKVHHRCSEKMLENSEFFHREYLIFFDQKCFLVEISLLNKKKLEKKYLSKKVDGSPWIHPNIHIASCVYRIQHMILYRIERKGMPMVR